MENILKCVYYALERFCSIAFSRGQVAVQIKLKAILTPTYYFEFT